MINTLLTIHIALLTISIVLSAVSAGMAILRRQVRTSMTFINVIVTAVGLVAGAVLLAEHPISAKCVVLLSYLVSFIGVQLYVKRRNQALALES